MTDTAITAEEACSRADSLEDGNDIDGAIQAMAQAIELAPHKPKYWALRGRLFALQEKWQAAIRDFDSALALKPNAPTTLYGRAQARSMIENLNGAIEDFERCIALEPTAADAYRELGYIRHYRGELQQALDAFRKAIELDPDRYSQVEVHIADIEQEIRKAKESGREK